MIWGDKGEVRSFDDRVKKGEVAGKILAFSFGKGAIQEAARLRNEDKILLDLVRVEDIISIAKKPNVKLVVELIEKKEKTESYKFEIKETADDGSQIEFYSFEILMKKPSNSLKGEPEHETPPLGDWGGLRLKIFAQITAIKPAPLNKN